MLSGCGGRADQQGWGPVEEGADCDLAFEASQWRTEAGVDTVTECDVRVVLTRNVESVRIHELERIAVGGTNQEQQSRARGDPLPSDIQFLRREAHGHLDRRERRTSRETCRAPPAEPPAVPR